MAITLRAAGATTTTVGTSITPAAPAGNASTDVVLVGIYGDYGTGAITPPAGWTVAKRQDSTTIQNMAVYWGLGSASFAAWTIPQVTNGAIAFALGYIGVDNVTPMDVAAGGQTNVASTNYTAPSITTVTDNAWFVCFIGADDTTGGAVGGDMTPGTGITERTQQGIQGGNGSTFALDGSDHNGPLSPAGATGTHVCTSVQIGSNISIGVTVALRPAGGAAAKLFRQNLMTGLGVGGPFFSNPIG